MNNQHRVIRVRLTLVEHRALSIAAEREIRSVSNQAHELLRTWLRKTDMELAAKEIAATIAAGKALEAAE